MGMPAGNFEAYADATSTTEEQKIYDRPEVIETENCIDFGDEDATRVKVEEEK